MAEVTNINAYNQIHPTSSSDDEETQAEDRDSIQEVDRYWPPPLDNTIKLSASSKQKPVEGFCFNNSGTRFATGSYDRELRIWDFGAIDKDRPEPICNTQPCSELIKTLEFSLNDELILIVSSSLQAAIIAKDGTKPRFCVKGDQYLLDMLNTKGHARELNHGCWSPKDKEIFLTSSRDSTLRIWDVNTMNQRQTRVIKIRSQKPGAKAIPNVCRFSRDAQTILTGCDDGSIMFWDTRRKFITTSAYIKEAHLAMTITGLDIAYGNQNLLCSRGEDHTLKVWDLRGLRNPLATNSDHLATLYAQTDCWFSPDDKHIIAGTTNTKSRPGCVHFLNSNDLAIDKSIEMPETGVIRTRWHPKINHVAYTTSKGNCFIAYDDQKSLGGFLAAELKGVKRKKYVSQRELSYNSTKIITPHALPLFKDDQQGPSKQKKLFKPEMPANEAKDGRVRTAGSTLSSFVARNIAKPVEMGNMDIRERILRHADEAEKNPKWISSFTRPTSAETPVHEDEAEDKA